MRCPGLYESLKAGTKQCLSIQIEKLVSSFIQMIPNYFATIVCTKEVIIRVREVKEVSKSDRLRYLIFSLSS